jgi:hypothetical protein
MLDVDAELERMCAVDIGKRRNTLPQVVLDDQRDEPGIAELDEPGNLNPRQTRAVEVAVDVDAGNAHLL